MTGVPAGHVSNRLERFPGERLPEYADLHKSIADGGQFNEYSDDTSCAPVVFNNQLWITAVVVALLHARA